MQHSGAQILAVLIIMPVYLVVAGFVGATPCCSGPMPCVEHPAPTPDCSASPGTFFPHSPCEYLHLTSSGSSHCRCTCSLDSVSALRSYVVTVSTSQPSQRFPGSANGLWTPLADFSSETAERYLIPPAPSRQVQDLACLRTIVLVC